MHVRDDDKTHLYHHAVEYEPDDIRNEHGELSHPFRKEFELNGHSVMGAQPGRKRRAEEDEPYE